MLKKSGDRNYCLKCTIFNSKDPVPVLLKKMYTNGYKKTHAIVHLNPYQKVSMVGKDQRREEKGT